MPIARRAFFVLLSSFFLAQVVLSSYVLRQLGSELRDDTSDLVRRGLGEEHVSPIMAVSPVVAASNPPSDWNKHNVVHPYAPPPVRTTPVANPTEVKQAGPKPTEGKPQPIEGKPQPTESKAQPTNGKHQPTESKRQPTKGKSQALKKKPRPVKVTRRVKVKIPRTKVGSQRLITGPQRPKVQPQSLKVQQQLTKVPKTKSRMGKGKIGALSALVGAGALLAGTGAAVGHKEGLFRREDGSVLESLSSLEQEATNPLLALTKE